MFKEQLAVAYRWLINGVVRPIYGGMSMLGTILLIVLILALLGALPTWPHSRSWGYYPSGISGVLLIVVIVLLLSGRI